MSTNACTLMQVPFWYKSQSILGSLNVNYLFLHNKLNSMHVSIIIIIGCHLWSIGGQTCKWHQC